MSDTKKVEPDEDLLEFLGGIDEVNDESRTDDVSTSGHERRGQARRAETEGPRKGREK
jgi:hypothetical protein